MIDLLKIILLLPVIKSLQEEIREIAISLLRINAKEIQVLSKSSPKPRPNLLTTEFIVKLLIFFKSVLVPYLGITSKSLRCITLFMLGYKYTGKRERDVHQRRALT